MWQTWQSGNQELRVTTKGWTEARMGFDAELVPLIGKAHGDDTPESLNPDSQYVNQDAAKKYQPELPFDLADHKSPQGPIYNLIVAVKAPFTTEALLSVRHRLGTDSTILLLQNGFGIVEELYERVFPDPKTRPNIMSGVITHGVAPSDNGWEVLHTGNGAISMSLLPRIPLQEIANNEEDLEAVLWEGTSRYLLRTVTRVPVLAAVGFGPTELLQIQLEKLAVNAVINPLTVQLDCRNGSLLYNFSVSRVMRMLLAEISLVLCALPELQGVPNVKDRFSPSRLEAIVISVLAKTADNVSSMLVDVRRGSRTEIEYINGYIVRRGEELGIKCVMNYMIMHLVEGKSLMVRKEMDDYVPLLRDS